MKLHIVLTLVAICGLSLAYDAKFNEIDVDKILADDKLFYAYVDCLMDKGSCEHIEHAADFRKLLPEVVETACAKCSPIQEHKFRKSVLALQERAPEKFTEFVKKYDPYAVHREKFAIFLTTIE